MRQDAVGQGPVVRSGPSPYRGSVLALGLPAQKVPEPAEQDLVLPGSTCSRLLEQKARLQHVLEDLERQRKTLKMRQNGLLGKGSSPETCQEAERLQQRNSRLAALTKQLKESCRHLQDTIEHLMNFPLPLPTQSSAEEPCMKSFPEQRTGGWRQPARGLLPQAQQNEVSQKELQDQMAADKKSSDSTSTFCQRCEELQGQLMQVAGENAGLAEENSRFRGQMRWAEKVQAENADLMRQLMRVTKERISVIQAIRSLQTRLKDAECKQDDMKETAESAQKEVKRDHGDTIQLFGAQVSEPENRFQSSLGSAWAEESPGSCLLSEEDTASETEPVAGRQSIILQAVGQQLGQL